MASSRSSGSLAFFAVSMIASSAASVPSWLSTNKRALLVRTGRVLCSTLLQQRQRALGRRVHQRLHGDVGEILVVRRPRRSARADASAPAAHRRPCSSGCPGTRDAGARSRPSLPQCASPAPAHRPASTARHRRSSARSCAAASPAPRSASARSVQSDCFSAAWPSQYSAFDAWSARRTLGFARRERAWRRRAAAPMPAPS